jgi:hypothetical protein
VAREVDALKTWRRTIPAGHVSVPPPEVLASVRKAGSAYEADGARWVRTQLSAAGRCAGTVSSGGGVGAKCSVDV